MRAFRDVRPRDNPLSFLLDKPNTISKGQGNPRRGDGVVSGGPFVPRRTSMKRTWTDWLADNATENDKAPEATWPSRVERVVEFPAQHQITYSVDAGPKKIGRWIGAAAPALIAPFKNFRRGRLPTVGLLDGARLPMLSLLQRRIGGRSRASCSRAGSQTLGDMDGILADGETIRAGPGTHG